MSRSRPSSSVWFLSYIKLQFFSRVRQFLQPKAAQESKSRTRVMVKKGEVQVRQAEVLDPSEMKIHEDNSAVLQRSVKRLHFGSWEEKEMAALEIGRLAREDVNTRKLMAELGVIPALVGMVATEVGGRRLVAVKALMDLANRTYTIGWFSMVFDILELGVSGDT